MNRFNLVNMSVTSCFLLGVNAAFAQEIRYAYRESPVPSVVELCPFGVTHKVIERSVTIETGNLDDLARLHPSLRETMRSDYAKRLSDMKDQLEMARVKGWISSEVYADLRNWHADVVKEEQILREKGAGIVAASDVDQLERHLNGLSYTIIAKISEGSRNLAGLHPPL